MADINQDFLKCRILHKSTQNSTLKVAVATREYAEIRFVGQHRLPVDLAGRNPRMTVGAQEYQILKFMGLDLCVVIDVMYLQSRRFPAGWDGTAMPGLDLDLPLKRQWQVIAIRRHDRSLGGSPPGVSTVRRLRVLRGRPDAAHLRLETPRLQLGGRVDD